MGGSERTFTCIWIYIYFFSSSLEFHSWSFYFSFLSFCSSVVVFVVVFFFLTPPRPPPRTFPHISGEARRDWTRYGKQTALSGRYHSNCLTVWFAVGFFFQPFDSPSLFSFPCLVLVVLLSQLFLASWTPFGFRFSLF